MDQPLVATSTRQPVAVPPLTCSSCAAPLRYAGQGNDVVGALEEGEALCRSCLYEIEHGSDRPIAGLALFGWTQPADEFAL